LKNIVNITQKDAASVLDNIVRVSDARHAIIVESAKCNTDPIKTLELPNSPVLSAAWTLVFMGLRRVRDTLSGSLVYSS
jgi:hypothetical protein